LNFADLCGNPDACDIQERPAIDKPSIHLMRLSLDGDPRGGKSIERQAKRLGKVVGGSKRENGQWLAQGKQVRHGFGDRPVAAADDDAIVSRAVTEQGFGEIIA
jgi:hypothetical protein